jgi:hypothetical protein
MSAPESAVEEERDVAVLDTKLASECVREFAVDANWDCRLLEVSFAVVAVVAGGLASEFRRLRIPPTAYETGYVKNDEARCGVLGGGEAFDASVVDDIAWAETCNCSGYVHVSEKRVA